MNDELQKKQRIEEIDRLVDLNNRERSKLNDEIEQLTSRRDAMLDLRSSLQEEQIRLLRELKASA